MTKAGDEAQAVTHTAAEAGSGVVQSAKEQGKNVASNTGREVRKLYGQARSQANDQAGAQQKRAAEGLHALSDEVGKMAEQGGGSGLATQVGWQASDKIDQMARWLDSREPGQILDEVKSYARRNPGMFLLGAAALGALAGRLTKNITQSTGAPSDADAPGSLEATRPGYAATSAPQQASTYRATTADAPIGTPTASSRPETYPEIEKRP